MSLTHIKTAFVGLAALAVLGACATATPYQQATDDQRGFSEQQIEQNRFRVQFAGNSLTDRRTVETYLLYRAAELTLANGFDYFNVVQRETEEDSRYVSTGFNSGFGPSYGYGYAPFYSGFACDYRFYGPRYARRAAFAPSRYGYRGGHYRDPFYDPFWGGSNEYREVVRYDAGAEIIMGRGPKPADPNVFDASQVVKNLGPNIVRPEAA